MLLEFELERMLTRVVFAVANLLVQYTSKSEQKWIQTEHRAPEQGIT